MSRTLLWITLVLGHVTISTGVKRARDVDITIGLPDSYSWLYGQLTGKETVSNFTSQQITELNSLIGTKQTQLLLTKLFEMKIKRMEDSGNRYAGDAGSSFIADTEIDGETSSESGSGFHDFEETVDGEFSYEADLGSGSVPDTEPDSGSGSGSGFSDTEETEENDASYKTDFDSGLAPDTKPDSESNTGSGSGFSDTKDLEESDNSYETDLGSGSGFVPDMEPGNDLSSGSGSGLLDAETETGFESDVIWRMKPDGNPERGEITVSATKWIDKLESRVAALEDKTPAEDNQETESHFGISKQTSSIIYKLPSIPHRYSTSSQTKTEPTFDSIGDFRSTTVAEISTEHSPSTLSSISTAVTDKPSNLTKGNYLMEEIVSQKTSEVFEDLGWNDYQLISFGLHIPLAVAIGVPITITIIVVAIVCGICVCRRGSRRPAKHYRKFSDKERLLNEEKERDFV